MLYQRCVRPPAGPAGAGRQVGLHSTATQKHALAQILSALRTRISGRTTDIRSVVRINCVVLKPACTPVPPAKDGSAAGDAGLAPPASALSEMATRRPTASGTFPSDILRFQGRANRAASTGRRWPAHATPKEVLSSIGEPILQSRPRAATGFGPPAQVQHPGFDCRLYPCRCLAPPRAWRDRSLVSRPGSG